MKYLQLSLIYLFFCSAATSPAAYAQAGGEITPKGIVYPRYTDANRPTGPLTIGTTIYNTGQNTHQYWNGSSWTNVSTPGSGGGPWSAVGNTVYNNTGTQVGVNAPDPTAALEVRGGSFIISVPYTVTNSPATNTYTIPYNGTIPTITNPAARILDPGGNGNVIGNTNYAGYVYIDTDGNALRFTFEGLEMGVHKIVFSTSPNLSDFSAKILEVYFENQSEYLNKPFIIRESNIYIHFVTATGFTSVPGFQLLYQTVTPSFGSYPPYTEPVSSGLVYNSQNYSFATGLARASGSYSTATGLARASGSYSTAMGFGNTNGFSESFSIGSDILPSRAGNDKIRQMKMHFEEIRLETGTNGDFTITPTQITTNNSLSVFGNNTVNLNGYGFLNRTGPTGIAPSAASVAFSVYASGRIIGSEFNAFSDARHKRLRSRSRGDTDLAQINRLAVSRYTFIDTVQKGNQEQLGLIAQEVEQVVPEAVSKIVDYIPSVYAMADRVSYDSVAHTLTVRTQQPHGFAAAEDIKVITAQEEHKVRIGTLIDAHTFRLNGWQKATSELFVFGKSVSDFRTVDYNRLFTMGISAIQELSRRVEQLEAENTQLKARNDELSQMKSDIATLKNLLLKEALPEKSAEK